MNIGVIGIGAGAAIIVIGVLAIFISGDEFAFIRGMMLIVTGILIFGLSFRFKVIRYGSAKDREKGKGKR
ncbi:hypothetical protein HRbin04_01343 [archaeon HR04]|nr:hypothetical protein HRbin04_01343 [archaeon HR04]